MRLYESLFLILFVYLWQDATCFGTDLVFFPIKRVVNLQMS